MHTLTTSAAVAANTLRGLSTPTTPQTHSSLSNQTISDDDSIIYEEEIIEEEIIEDDISYYDEEIIEDDDSVSGYYEEIIEEEIIDDSFDAAPTQRAGHTSGASPSHDASFQFIKSNVSTAQLTEETRDLFAGIDWHFDDIDLQDDQGNTIATGNFFADGASGYIYEAKVDNHEPVVLKIMKEPENFAAELDMYQFQQDHLGDSAISFSHATATIHREEGETTKESFIMLEKFDGTLSNFKGDPLKVAAQLNAIADKLQIMDEANTEFMITDLHSDNVFVKEVDGELSVVIGDSAKAARSGDTASKFITFLTDVVDVPTETVDGQKRFVV